MSFSMENLHLDIGAYLKGLTKLHEVPLYTPSCAVHTFYSEHRDQMIIIIMFLSGPLEE